MLALLIRIKNILTKENLCVFSAALLVVSMIYSPFLLSVAMWGLVFVALWQAADRAVAEGRASSLKTWRAWGQGLLGGFRRLGRQPALYLFALLLIWPALSFFWSEDQGYWLSRVRVRIPFLVLPWAFANLPRLSDRQYCGLLYLLVWALVFTCLGIALHYSANEEEILVGLARGQPIPVPRSHIRFNLVLATGIVAGVWLWARGFVLRYVWERKALACAVVLLFGFIHFLSVRSGLAALYAALLFSAGYVVVVQRRWWLGAVLLLFLSAAPVIAFYNSPSLYTRISYMFYDWGQYQKSAGSDYSDAGRWVSLEVGLQLWREHPLLGTGIGDLPAETRRVVQGRFPNYVSDPKLPHNQFLYLLAGLGLIGLLTSLMALLAPFAERQTRSFYLFCAFQVIVFVSFLVEYTLETSIGAAFYLFYTLWFREMGKVMMNDE